MTSRSHELTAQVPNHITLEIDKLKIDYASRKGPVRAVDGVSLQVGHGEIVGLVGESGSGKSTIGRAILGLHPPKGTTITGSILLDGQEIVGRSETEFRRLRGSAVAMVFQNAQTALDPVWSVGWQMRKALRCPEGTSRQRQTEIVTAALHSVGMPRPGLQLARYPFQLSGGMKQRVVLAMGMLNNPSILIADEPTTALDVTVQAQVLHVMKKTVRQKNVSLLFITHDLGVVANMCDRVVVLKNGQVVEEATVDALFYQPEHEYTKQLLEAVPKL